LICGIQDPTGQKIIAGFLRICSQTAFLALRFAVSVEIESKAAAWKQKTSSARQPSRRSAMIAGDTERQLKKILKKYQENNPTGSTTDLKLKIGFCCGRSNPRAPRHAAR